MWTIVPERDTAPHYRASRQGKMTASRQVQVSSRQWRKSRPSTERAIFNIYDNRKINLHAMRMGPGKHLKGLELAGGIVKPEEVRFLCLDLHFLVLTGRIFTM
jgi:hypothetical protein